ncbi:sialate O-acetylesterase [Roseiconus nitratireducens]|uniref:Sialate O-acetylesterase n=1 Tax=Roseiconus nitratireducens TaxID=2605748 RepID=A0A5M6DA47_9BACT|nr:sialate O-acetylesterase [Roseiconus nitratireducens]KAA5543162.1 sialate O-acetylesterase [Roseiconus nitratireducens]
MMRLLLVTGLLVSFPAASWAELALPHFFSDHMVLQRERDAAIWGTATANADVTVTLKDQRVTTHADAQGRWRTTIPTGKADGNGTQLTVASGDDQQTIRDVLIGEVWFASGQSNMVFTMNRVPEYQSVIAKADYPQIRMFNAPTVTSVEPKTDIDGQWTICSPETASGYSAVAFFFARKLQQELGVPIGVIKSAWGGKPVETFTSREALTSLPQTRDKVDAAIKADASFDLQTANAAYQKRLEQWNTAVEKRKALPPDQRGRQPRKPSPPKRPLNTEGQPGVLFNSMINPFVGYTLRGAIWYQGEANAKPGAIPYDITLPLMIRDWRQRWDDDFSFYFVQLANFRDPTTEAGSTDPWALLQDRMRRILQTTPKTGMAVINDVGEAKDIHPKNKQAPGERLARWALAKDYDRDLVYSGPLFQSEHVSGDTIEITFDHVGEGLRSRDGESLNRFEIAGDDRVWHWADAKIVAPNRVAVSSPDVSKPIAVRYAWASNPQGANLVNSEGLPTSVFRTDQWDDVEPAATTSARAAQNPRRQIAEKIQALKQKRNQLQPGSEAFREVSRELNESLKTFRSSAPKATSK